MTIIEFICIILIFLFSIVIHELAHGEVAVALGDPTPQVAGRLTLNPLKHLDLFGSIILPGILILMSMVFGGGIILGWAKPVPVNPFNFRDQKYGSAKVALAGPLANIILALIFGLFLRWLPFGFSPYTQKMAFIFAHIVWVNLLLAIFNLIPIPPLDGSHILFTFLPPGSEKIKIFLQEYGFLILLFIIFYFFHPLISFVNWLFHLIVKSPFF